MTGIAGSDAFCYFGFPAITTCVRVTLSFPPAHPASLASRMHLPLPGALRCVCVPAFLLLLSFRLLSLRHASYPASAASHSRSLPPLPSRHPSQSRSDVGRAARRVLVVREGALGTVAAPTLVINARGCIRVAASLTTTARWRAGWRARATTGGVLERPPATTVTLTAAAAVAAALTIAVVVVVVAVVAYTPSFVVAVVVVDTLPSLDYIPDFAYVRIVAFVAYIAYAVDID